MYISPDAVYTNCKRGYRNAGTWAFYAGLRKNTELDRIIYNFLKSTEVDEVSTGQHNYRAIYTDTAVFRVYLIPHKLHDRFYNIVDTLNIEHRVVDGDQFSGGKLHEHC